MAPPSAQDGPVDGSALCRECGLCCDWQLFGAVPLLPEELPWASSKRLRVIQRAEKLTLELPCAVLEARGSERVCGDYEHRPAACREFECKVLSRLKSGDLSQADALGLVKQARALTAGLEERLRETEGKNLGAKLARLADAFQRSSVEDRAVDAQTLLDVGVLSSLILPAFHQHEARDVSSEAESLSLAARISDPETWRILFADHGDDLVADAPDGRMGPVAFQEQATELRQEGYTRLGPVLALREAQALASIVSSLHEAGWPPVFAFLHAATWKAVRRLEPWVHAVLGEDYELLSAFWAWHLRPGAATSGWPPHRDRIGVTTAEDGTPNLVSVWVALTDATPDNGCIYVLPRRYDPSYGAVPNRVDVLDVQNVHALPVRAGSALMWNHQLVHWGGRVSPRARDPRMNLGLEFRRRGTPDETRAIDRSRIPSFDERVRLVAEQILQYERFGGVERRFQQAATRLIRR